MMNWRLTILTVALSVAPLPTVMAQESGSVPMGHKGMSHEGMSNPKDVTMTGQTRDMDHGAMQDMGSDSEHGSMPGMGFAMEHGAKPDVAMEGGAAVPEDASMQGMNHEAAAMQGGSAPSDARDPHAYSGGQDFGPIPRPRLADEHNFGSLLIDRLEYAESNDNSFSAYDLQGWFGRDYDRAVLKAEGEVDDGELHEGHTELLWGHAIAAYWDTQLGLRYDSGEIGPNRTWLAFGVQGLAPYWFEVDVAGYLGEEGRTALRLEAEYELLLTQRLILQPRIEASLYGKADEERELGKGLSEAVVGLRLRYEIKRQFAPYLGVEWAGLYGETADIAKAAGADTDETRWVAGIRAWF
jgi:copper resistance protein B